MNIRKSHFRLIIIPSCDSLIRDSEVMINEYVLGYNNVP